MLTTSEFKIIPVKLILRILVLPLLVSWWHLCDGQPVDAGGSTPNIVLMIADDMEWDDAGCYGHPVVRTPHLDRLAEAGMRFTRGFVTSSSCSPSRASLITGLYPHQTGAEELHWPVPPGRDTFVRILGEAGYWTAAAGKWHLGETLKDHFDLVMEVDTSGFQLPAGQAGESGEFRQSYDGDARSGCADWLEVLRSRPEGQPFFLWLAALDPHRPYDEDAINDPHDPEQAILAPYHPDDPDVRKDYALYYDEIHRLDYFVGQVMGELRKQGVWENTLVVFISDNGKPFPRDKTTLYDSGIRSPWLVSWPDKIAGGQVCDRLVSSIDLAPGFLDAAGLEIPGQMEGVSFLSLLSAPGEPIRPYIYAEKNWHDYEDHARAVRDDRYKLIINSYTDLPNTPPADAVRSPIFQAMLAMYKSGVLPEYQRQIFTRPRPAVELFDTLNDPDELNNMAGHPDMVLVERRLSRALNQWVTRTGDYAPSLRTADEFDRETGRPTAARVRPRWSKERMVSDGLTAP